MLEEVARILLAPACVIAITVAGYKWGSTVAGILGGLPVVAGPIILILALEHGRSFAATAAEGCVIGLMALASFVIVYGLMATRAGPVTCLFCGWGAFLAVVGLLSLLDLPLGLAVVGVLAVFAACFAILPSPSERAVLVVPAPWWDLPMRGLATLLLVVTLTVLSGALGPSLSGLLTPFPVITSVLAFFVHSQGGDEVHLLLRGYLVGSWGFAAFCLTLALSLPAMSLAASYAVAIAVALVAQSLTLVLGRERQPATLP